MATSSRHGTARRASAAPPLLLALAALLLLTVPGPQAAAAWPDHLQTSETTATVAVAGRHLAAVSASILDEDDLEALDLDALDPIPAELPITDAGLITADTSSQLADGDGVVARLLAATTKKNKKKRSPPPPPPRSLKRWSSPYSWPNGTVPQLNATVEIPKGTTVLLDVSPPQLFLLKVLGTLVFGDVDLHLTAGVIAVVDGGRLEIGTQAKPYLNEAVITFVGDKTWASLWGWGTKGLVVSGGTVEMVGRTVTSWTHLAETAPVGARLVRLAQPVTGWRVGDQVGFAPTDYDPLEAETRRITKISANRRVIALSERLDYQHWGETEQVAGPNNTTVTLDERAEVALLTRNIRLEGAPEATGKFGGHVMVLSGKVTLVGVELTAMGQRGHLGRYPVHFHYTYNTSAGSLVQDTAVHHCFQRGFVIHRTNNVTIDRNVVFDSYGHHYFLESAIEMFNNFTNNLAVLVRTPPLEDRTDPIQGDIDPPLIVAYGDREYTENVKYSGFWITNSHNRFVGNVVAGVANGHGFWFLQGVRTPGRDDDITDDVFAANYNRPLLEFRDNVAHTVMRDPNETGFNVGYGPSTTGSCFQLDRMYDPNNLNASTVYINVPPSAPPPPPPSPSDSLSALASARAASSSSGGNSSYGYDTIYDPPNLPIVGGTAYKCNFCGLWYPESPATVASGMVIADSLLGILAPEGPVDFHVLAQNITIVARSKNQPADRNLEWFWSSLEPILAGPTAVSTAPEHIDSIMVLDDVSLVGPFTTEDFMGDQGSPYSDRHK